MGKRLGLANFPVESAGAQTKDSMLLQLLRESARSKTAKITSAAAATAVELINSDDVPEGHAVKILGMIANVNGGTVWATTATVTIRTKAVSPTALVTLAAAGLTANAVLDLATANVTNSNSVLRGTGADAGFGVEMVGDVNGTGSDLYVTLIYQFVRQP